MKFGIGRRYEGAPGRWENYVKACDKLGIGYIIFDILSDGWLEHILEHKSELSGIFGNPTCQSVEEYDMYMERLYFINKELGIPIYPAYHELKLYENKRYCTTWLKYHGYSIPDTWTFANKQETLAFLEKAKFPLVIKASIGAGASAVHIINTRHRAESIARMIFGFNRLLSFGYISWVRYKNFPLMIPLIGNSLKHYVIIQDYIPIKWEWRIIKIGNSYFGHQKLLKGKYASGSGRVGWVAPPRELLDLLRNLCLEGNFNAMAMDVFESLDGKYYINELQTLFGSYLDSQMFIDGKPGRYLFEDGEYRFEEGYYNVFGSCLLRVENFVEILEKQHKDSNQTSPAQA